MKRIITSELIQYINFTDMFYIQNQNSSNHTKIIEEESSNMKLYVVNDLSEETLCLLNPEKHQCQLIKNPSFKNGGAINDGIYIVNLPDKLLFIIIELKNSTPISNLRKIRWQLQNGFLNAGLLSDIFQFPNKDIELYGVVVYNDDPCETDLISYHENLGDDDTIKYYWQNNVLDFPTMKIKIPITKINHKTENSILLSNFT